MGVLRVCNEFNHLTTSFRVQRGDVKGEFDMAGRLHWCQARDGTKPAIRSGQQCR